MRSRSDPFWLVALGIIALAAPLRAAGAQLITVANLVVGDGVFVIKTNAAQQILVGAGSGKAIVTVTVDAAATQQFVAEASALVQRGTRKIPADVSDHPVLEERTSGRAISLSRRVELQSDNSKDLTYHFYVSDERLRGFAIVAKPDETKAVLAALQSAAQSVSDEGGAADSGSTHPQRPLGMPIPNGD